MDSILENLVDSFKAGERLALSRAISLVEDEKLTIGDFLKEVSRESPVAGRIGITGPPGSGKSTLVSALAHSFRASGEHVGILSVDPTSPFSGGALLGDRVRMNDLSGDPGVFIRSVASRGSLGGLSGYSEDIIELMEAFGLTKIIVETVGVGQSESEVHTMVDFLMMLQIVGGGDDLQAIKRGVYEKIDLLLINKADQKNKIEAEIEKENFINNFALFPRRDSGWHPKAQTCSSIEKTGINEVWKTVMEFEKITRENNCFYKKRKAQNLIWFRHLVANNIQDFITNQSDLKSEIEGFQEQIKNEEINSIDASERITKTLRKIFKQL